MLSRVLATVRPFHDGLLHLELNLQRQFSPDVLGLEDYTPGAGDALKV